MQPGKRKLGTVASRGKKENIGLKTTKL